MCAVFIYISIQLSCYFERKEKNSFTNTKCQQNFILAYTKSPTNSLVASVLSMGPSEDSLQAYETWISRGTVFKAQRDRSLIYGIVNVTIFYSS